MGSHASSSDEGEIIESGVENSKATSLPQIDGSGVDRPDRSRVRYSRSPEHGDSRFDEPPSRRSISPRGYKRSRDDRDSHHHGGGRGGSSDPRRFKVHYEDDSRDDHRRTRPAYEDLDRPPSRGSYHRYDDLDRSNPRPIASRYDARDSTSNSRRYDDRGRDHDRYSEKRPRTRSPSPYRSNRGAWDRRDRDIRDGDRLSRQRNGNHAESMKYSAQNDRQPRGEAAKRAPGAEAGANGKKVAKFDQGATGEPNSQDPARLQTSKQSPASLPSKTEPEQTWEAEEPMDEEAEIERRRRRREELLRKSRASTPLVVQAIQADKPVSFTTGSSQNTPLRAPGTPISADSPAMTPGGNQDGMSPDALHIANDQDLINTHVEGKLNEEDGPSAADYDPTLDMQEDERRHGMRHGVVGLHGEDRRQSITSTGAEKVAQETKENSAGDADEDDFDMFAEDFDEDKFVAPKPAPKAAVVTEEPASLGQANGAILEDDDKEGYYKIRPGEILNGRYQIQSGLGKGMFSGVARAVDITNKKLVAIKMMRNNDALRKGGFTEIAILQKLNSADPENKKHIVKFERSFEHRGHLCMAFENLSLNLREVLKKFGNNVGINLGATRAYAYQIFLALAHMRKCSIIHADLKPDNILVNESRSILKICDLGTAIDRSDAATAHNEITPYLVSRFYRAPEIILGMPYDYSIDMWSIGCTLYELYTGKILFTGDSNNQMLRAIMEIRGKMSGKLYRRGQLWQMHFDELGNFVSLERDKVLGKTAVRTLTMVKPIRDLRTRLMAASSGMNDLEIKQLNQFYDLLDRCLNLNPDKRITPTEALKHPFFTEKVGPSSHR